MLNYKHSYTHHDIPCTFYDIIDTDTVSPVVMRLHRFEYNPEPQLVGYANPFYEYVLDQSNLFVDRIRDVYYNADKIRFRIDSSRWTKDSYGLTLFMREGETFKGVEVHDLEEERYWLQRLIGPDIFVIVPHWIEATMNDRAPLPTKWITDVELVRALFPYRNVMVGYNNYTLLVPAEPATEPIMFDGFGMKYAFERILDKFKKDVEKYKHTPQSKIDKLNDLTESDKYRLVYHVLLDTPERALSLLIHEKKAYPAQVQNRFPKSRDVLKSMFDTFKERLGDDFVQSMNSVIFGWIREIISLYIYESVTVKGGSTKYQTIVLDNPKLMTKFGIHGVHLNSLITYWFIEKITATTISTASSKSSLTQPINAKYYYFSQMFDKLHDLNRFLDRCIDVQKQHSLPLSEATLDIVHKGMNQLIDKVKCMQDVVRFPEKRFNTE